MIQILVKLATVQAWKQMAFHDISERINIAEETENGDRTPSVVEQINTTLSNTVTLVNSQAQELFFTSQAVNRSVTHVANNEDGRLACLVSFNGAVGNLNGVLSGMVTGAQLINNVIDVANRVKNTMTRDVERINRNIAVIDNWQPVMTDWANFVETQTSYLDGAQTSLLGWSSKVQAALNKQKSSSIQIGREVWNLESDIISWHEKINSAANLFKYSPVLLTVAEAASPAGQEANRRAEFVFNPFS